MKMIKNILFFALILTIKSDETIDFSSTLSSGTGYSVSDNTVTISSDGTYTLQGTNTNKNIIVSSSATLIFNSLSLTSTGSLTPLIIDSSNSVSLTLTGTSTLTDSSSNENEGVIYLKSGASLTISGSGTLNLSPNKNMAINGTDSTSLTVDGGNIVVSSSTSGVGGIYLRKLITFNDGTYKYTANSGTKHAIDSEGNITIKKGTYTISSGSGKGIQTEKYLYLGQTSSDNSDLTINIDTSNEGIEAEIIEVYSGTITIDADEDGINAAGDDCDEEGTCKGNCKCYMSFSGGEIDVNAGEDGLDSNGDITISGGKIIVYGASSGIDQPIDQDGRITITGGTLFAAGSNEMGGVSATNSQQYLTYTNTIASGKTITITDSSNNQVLSLNNKKEVKYVYFTSSGSGFTLNVGDSSSSTTSTNSTNSTNSTISTTVNLSENIILSYYLFALIILLL